jgi:hypothetical protein
MSRYADGKGVRIVASHTSPVLQKKCGAFQKTFGGNARTG